MTHEPIIAWLIEDPGLDGMPEVTPIGVYGLCGEADIVGPDGRIIEP